MTGILLINIGSPGTQKEMKHFLRLMFLDPAIMPFNRVLRNMLSMIISIFRYKRSWKKYRLIGGSPLKSFMEKLKEEMHRRAEENFLIEIAYSYSQPLIESVCNKLIQSGVTTIISLPLYPQSSFSTSGSVKRDLMKVQRKHPQLICKMMEGFCKFPSFIDWWAGLVQDTLREKGMIRPLLLFSAHSIPQRDIDKGDTYTNDIEQTGRFIAEKTGLDFRIAYQSKIGPVKWAEPSVHEVLKEMEKEQRAEILIVPLSFIHENLETLYDIDKEILPQGRINLPNTRLERVCFPESVERLADVLLALINHSTIRK